MANLTRFGKQIHATAIELGVNNVDIRRRRKHYLLTGEGAHGNIIKMHFATTPSDWRAGRNIEAMLKRSVRS